MALIDQLLAGAAVVPGATADTASTDSTTPAPLLDAGLQVQAQSNATAPTAPEAAQLLNALARQLSDLKDQVDAGQEPDPDLLRRLGETADSLGQLLAAQAAQASTLPAATSPAPAAPLDPLAAITASSSASGIATAAAPSRPTATSSSSSAAGKFIAALSIESTTPAGVVSANDGPPPPSAPAAALSDLAQKLNDIGKSVAAVAPDVGNKLELLGSALQTVAAAPQLVEQMSQQLASAGTTLESMVRRLFGDKTPAPVAAAPQLSASAAISPSSLAEPLDKVQLKTPAASDSPPRPSVVAVAHKVAAAIGDAAATADPKPMSDAAPTAEKSQAAATVDTDGAAVASASTTTTTQTARAFPAAYQAAQNPISMGQVAFEMVRQMHQGQSRFSIRLDPAELGRIDVKMHVDSSGAVTAKLTVDRAETLDMFQRDRGTLERALSQAGLDSGKTSLEFSLRQNPFAGMAGGDQRPPVADPGYVAAATGEDDDIAVPAVTLYRGLATAGSVNLFV